MACLVVAAAGGGRGGKLGAKPRTEDRQPRRRLRGSVLEERCVELTTQRLRGGEATEERVAAAAALHRRLLDRTRGDACGGDAEWWRNRPFADFRVACTELMRAAEG